MLDGPHVPFRADQQQKKRPSDSDLPSKASKKSRPSNESQGSTSTQRPPLVPEDPAPQATAGTSKSAVSASRKPSTSKKPAATEKATTRTSKAAVTTAEKVKKKELLEDNKLVTRRRDVLHELRLAVSPSLEQDPFFSQVLDPLAQLLLGGEEDKPSKYVVLESPLPSLKLLVSASALLQIALIPVSRDGNASPADTGTKQPINGNVTKTDAYEPTSRPLLFSSCQLEIWMKLCEQIISLG